MVLDRRKRVPPGTGESRIRQVYPTDKALSVRGLEPVAARDPRSASTHDPLATRCAQCGFPIENRTARDECPLCLSDNFNGSFIY